MILATPATHADPITPSYTITDLGNDPNPSFGTYTSGSGVTVTTVPATSGNTVIIAANGQTAYPFSQSLSSTSMPAPSGFPVPEAAPPAEGGTFPNYSGTGLVTLYSNGIAIALDQLTQSAGDEWQRSDLYYVRQNADGTWGQPVVIAQGPTHTGPDIGQGPGIGAFVDKAGDILVSTQSTTLRATDREPLQCEYPGLHGSLDLAGTRRLLEPPGPLDGSGRADPVVGQ